MSPFDMQYSKVIYDERVNEAAYRRLFNENGILSTRNLSGFGEAMFSLAQKLKLQSQSRPTASTSQIS